MQQIATLFGEKRKPQGKRRRTERGDIFDILLSRLNPDRIRAGYSPLNYGCLAHELAGIATKDLYALISKIRDGERRGIPAGAIFWTEIRPLKAIAHSTN